MLPLHQPATHVVMSVAFHCWYELERLIQPASQQLAAWGPLLSDAEARPKQLLAESKAALAAGDLKQASLKARLLENLLRVTPRYQQSLGELFTNVKGLPLTSFSPGLASRQ